MEPIDVTIEILKQIRDDVRGVSARVDGTNSRLDETNSRLDETNSRLDETNSRLDETNTRIESTSRSLRSEIRAEIHELRLETRAGFEQHGQAIVRLVHEVRAMGERFDNFLRGAHQKDHADLRDRVARLETKVG